MSTSASAGMPNCASPGASSSSSGATTSSGAAAARLRCRDIAARALHRDAGALPCGVASADVVTQRCRYRSTVSVWQTTPKQCPDNGPCKAPETIGLSGVLGALPILPLARLDRRFGTQRHPEQAQAEQAQQSKCKQKMVDVTSFLLCAGTEVGTDAGVHRAAVLTTPALQELWPPLMNVRKVLKASGK